MFFLLLLLGCSTLLPAARGQSEETFFANDGSGGGGSSSSLTAKNQKIAELESKLAAVRESQVFPAADEAAKRRAAYATAKGQAGWWPTASEKERLDRLENSLRDAESNLARVEAHALDLHSRIKRSRRFTHS